MLSVLQKQGKGASQDPTKEHALGTGAGHYVSLTASQILFFRYLEVYGLTWASI